MIFPGNYPEQALAWVDVETTGLDAHGEHLLQVACLMTDLDLNELDPQGFEATIRYTPEQAARMRAAAVSFVQEMHDRSGLWSMLSDPDVTSPLGEVQAELLDYVTRFAPAARTARLAGNSVRLDLNFLDVNTPEVTGHLHYRMVDVSTVTGLAQWWCGVPPMEKQQNHTAMADIRESLAELRYLRERVFDAANAARAAGLVPE